MARYTPSCSSTDVGMMCSSSRITIGVLLSSRFKYYSLPLSHKHIVLFVNPSAGLSLKRHCMWDLWGYADNLNSLKLLSVFPAWSFAAVFSAGRLQDAWRDAAEP